jgi:GMP synthase (glutamine-hydrolysing)
MGKWHDDTYKGETVLVVDFGAQYAQLIARRVREARVYSEIVSHRITAAEVRSRGPKAIILSGYLLRRPVDCPTTWW